MLKYLTMIKGWLIASTLPLISAAIVPVLTCSASSSPELAPPAIARISDDGMESLRATMKRMDEAILSCDPHRVMSFASKDIRFRTIDASGPVEDKTELGFDRMYESVKEVYAGLQDYTYKRTHIKMIPHLREDTATSYDVIQETARLSNKPVFIKSEQMATFRREGRRWILVDLQSKITEFRDMNDTSPTAVP